MRYVMLAVVAIVISGCITPPGWIQVKPPEVVIGPAPTNSPPVVVPPVDLPAVVVPPVVYEYIPGNVMDRGPEIYNPNFNGMDVRLSANDVQNLNPRGVPAKGSWYPLDSKVVSGLVLAGAPDGGIIASAKDFTSARTGLRYHFCAFMVQTTSGPLVVSNPLTIPRGECHNTLRIMYATVKP